jgi:hypothetical protein
MTNYTFDQLLDFTRTTSGTFVGSNGLIQTTPASANLLLWTQQFDNAAWTKARTTVTANTTVAPDGTSTADKLVEDTTASSTHFTSQSANYTAGTTYTLSVSVKAAERNWFDIQLPAALMGTIRNAYFDVSNGTVGTVTSGITAAIVSLGNGWYRCSVTFTATASAGTGSAFLLANADNSISYTGDGTSGLFIWGAQLEAVPDANLTLGTELVTNPGPFADTTGWTDPLGTIAAVSSSLVLTVPVGGSARAVSSAMSGLTIGAAYQISVTGVAGDAVNKSIRITTNADGSTGALFTQSISGTSITYTFVATATTHYLALVVTGGTLNQTFSVSQASVKQITAITGMPSTYTRNNGGVFPPRFDYDPVTLAPKGLLVEEARTNLLLQSETFDSGTWNKGNATITANATVSPDGAADADALVENAATSTHFCQQFVSFTSGVAYTFSTYVKAGTRAWCSLLLPTSAFGASTGSFFGLSGAGSLGDTVGTLTSRTITAVGNGWYRITITATATATTGGNVPISAASANSTSFYTGVDGAEALYLYGAQLEAGAFATSYIPTVASQVTRTADQCSIVAPMFAPWYNQSEGSFVVEADTVSPSNKWVYVANDGTVNNYIGLDIASAGNARFRAVVGGVSQAGLSSAAVVSANTIIKQAGAYANNSFNQALDGVLNSGDTSGSVPTVFQFVIGAQSSLGGFLNGHIRSIRYYPVRLSDAQLQALTA